MTTRPRPRRTRPTTTVGLRRDHHDRRRGGHPERRRDRVGQPATSRPLVELVKAAGLAETLSGAGPFTIFAPTNEAFSKVPAATLAELQADPQGALANVLKLHV